MKIVLYDDDDNAVDEIAAPKVLAEEMMNAARDVLHTSRY